MCLPLNTLVTIDLSWYLECYGHSHLPFIVEHGHGKRGVVCDSWIEVDGEGVYNILCDDGVVRGAYGRKDLKCAVL